jgi:uncharacterized membrane protein (DUF485 family)
MAEHKEMVITRNARLGLGLFAIYLLLYGGFMALNVLNPKLMASTPLFGVNLAILYGFGLIVAALVLALIYMGLCTPAASPDVKKEDAQ